MNHELHIYEPTDSDPIRPNDVVLVSLSTEQSPWLPRGHFALHEHRRNIDPSQTLEGTVIGVLPGNMRRAVLISIEISGVTVDVPCYIEELQKKQNK